MPEVSIQEAFDKIREGLDELGIKTVVTSPTLEGLGHQQIRVKVGGDEDPDHFFGINAWYSADSDEIVVTTEVRIDSWVQCQRKMPK